MKLHLTLFLSITLSTVSLFPKVIIWDIGGVLLDTSSFAMGKSIGFSHFLKYLVFDWKSPNIKPLVFDVLDMMECPEVPHGVYAYTADGIALPAIMCHWQAGTISGQQIIKNSYNHIAELANLGYFVSIREQELVQKTIEKMFDPQSLASCTFAIPAGINLLADCAREVTNHGIPKNKLIALSNWDEDSFLLVRERYPEVFNNFDLISVSGKTGLLKPRTASFKSLIKKCTLIPQDCLVIDDQKRNLDVAEKLGFETFLVDGTNFSALRKRLIQCGALS